MCVLMLRGPQTVGEVRGRTGRLYEFAELREAEETLEGSRGATSLWSPSSRGRRGARRRATRTCSRVTPAFEEPAEEDRRTAFTSRLLRRARLRASASRVLEAEVESLQRRGRGASSTARRVPKAVRVRRVTRADDSTDSDAPSTRARTRSPSRASFWASVSSCRRTTARACRAA
jgi:hypothetical protein